jgi:hypothetical protein
MKPRKLIKFLAGCLALAAMADSCVSGVTVSNQTSFEVRAVVSSGKKFSTISPSPGESSFAETGDGPYRVTVFPTQEWLDHAKATRAFLNEQLANADQLSGPQLLEVVRRLKDIALKIKQFEDAAQNTARCSGKITADGGGSVTVSTAADGSLKVVCR